MKDLDHRIATEVMGWKRLSYSKAFPNSSYHKGVTKLHPAWFDKDNYSTNAWAIDEIDYPIWSPSTNIEHAFEVLGKFDNYQLFVAEREYRAEVEAFINDEWTTSIKRSDQSIAHAICLAALDISSRNKLNNKSNQNSASSLKD